MSIEKEINRIPVRDLLAQAGERLPHTVRYPDIMGETWVDEIRAAFVTALPEDEDDIKAHVKNRDDAQWGVHLEGIRIAGWSSLALEFRLDQAPLGIGNNETIEQELAARLDELRYVLVTVLCEAAVEAYETAECEYVAIVNVPGYLPDSEPTEFATATDGWDHLADEREFLLAEHGIEHTADEAWLEMKRLATLPLKEQTTGVIADNPAVTTGYDLGLAYTVTARVEV